MKIQVDHSWKQILGNRRKKEKSKSLIVRENTTNDFKLNNLCIAILISKDNVYFTYTEVLDI